MLGIHLFYTFSENDSSPSELRNDLITQLEAIESEHSLTGAAKKVGMSYRYFWGRIEAWEQTLGQRLVSREQGKPATLTPLGRKLLWAERSVQAKYAMQITQLNSELTAAFSAAMDPKAPILTIAGCYDHFIASLQEPAFQAGLICDFQFNSGCEGLRQLAERSCTIAGFNFAEHATVGSEAYQTFSPYIDPERMEGCFVSQRSQGLVVAKHNPHQLHTLTDVFAKGLRYAGRSPTTGTYTLQESLLANSGIDTARVKALSVEYPSHLAVATAVASGKADAGLCIAHAALQRNVSFLPLQWENYYLAWFKEDRALVEPFLTVLAQTLDNTPAEEGRTLANSLRILSWRDELPWW